MTSKICWACLVVIVASTAACDRSVGPTTVPTAAPPAVAPSSSSEVVAAPGASGGVAASPADAASSTSSRIIAELGAETVGQLRAAQRVSVARLGTEAARRAEENAMSSPARIAGYPISGSPRQLTPADARALGDLLTRDDSYDFEIARRCANSAWLGARFDGQGSSVEVAFGKPCDQVVFAWRTPSGVKQWGSIVTPEVASAFAALVQ